jgi:hypothetical protein
MVKNKVTKDDLLKFNVGDQKVFTLPTFGKARSAQSYAHQQKKATMGSNNPMEFKAILGDPIPETGQCSVTITRIA